MAKIAKNHAEVVISAIPHYFRKIKMKKVKSLKTFAEVSGNEKYHAEVMRK